MWRVSALDRDGREVARVELADGELTIGRDADRQLILPSASVSRRHARVMLKGDRAFIVDEGSANGVLVDGTRISAPTEIVAASRIHLAEFRLRCLSLAAELPTPAFAPSQAPVGEVMRLVADGGPFDGRVLELPPGELLIGRAVDNDLVFDDPSLSRKHARLRREGTQLELEDLGSSNGCFINGRKVGRGHLGAGDRIKLGDLTFRVEGNIAGGTRSVTPTIPTGQLYALLGGGAATVVMLILALVVLAHPPGSDSLPPSAAIARIAGAARQHFQSGRALYARHDFAAAKDELVKALALDPASLPATRLLALATAGPKDERALASGKAMLAVGDHEALERALRLVGTMSEDAPERADLQEELEAALSRFGLARCRVHEYAECAWALCRAFEVATVEARPDAEVERALAEATAHAHLPACVAAER